MRPAGVLRVSGTTVGSPSSTAYSGIDRSTSSIATTTTQSRVRGAALPTPGSPYLTRSGAVGPKAANRSAGNSRRNPFNATAGLDGRMSIQALVPTSRSSNGSCELYDVCSVASRLQTKRNDPFFVSVRKPQSKRPTPTSLPADRRPVDRLLLIESYSKTNATSKFPAQAYPFVARPAAKVQARPEATVRKMLRSQRSPIKHDFRH